MARVSSNHALHTLIDSFNLIFKPKAIHLQLILVNTINANQLSLKDQGGTSRDRTHVAVAISKLRGNSQGALLANAHIKEALVPTELRSERISIDQNQKADLDSPLNHAASSKLEGERRAAVVAGIEFLASVLEFAAVVHGDTVAVLGLAVALDLVGGLDAEVGGEGQGGQREEEGCETHCDV